MIDIFEVTSNFLLNLVKFTAPAHGRHVTSVNFLNGTDEEEKERLFI